MRAISRRLDKLALAGNDRNSFGVVTCPVGGDMQSVIEQYYQDHPDFDRENGKLVIITRTTV